jgi:hypothetical protein
LTPGNYSIEATFEGLGKNFPKFESVVTAETMQLFSFKVTQNNCYGNQTLTVTLTIYVEKNYAISKCENIGCKELQTTIGNILDNSTFSDFKFIVKGKEFKVHRNILSTASPVFDKLFTVDMEEANNNECAVADIEPAIFEQLLRFIYKRELPENLSKVAMKLFEAAHYYEINKLKEICLKDVFELLSKSNAVKIFNWAWIYDCEELKDKAWIIIKG